MIVAEHYCLNLSFSHQVAIESNNFSLKTLGHEQTFSNKIRRRQQFIFIRS